MVPHMPTPPSIRLRAPTQIEAEIRPPGSKSLSNRALLLAAMAPGESTLQGVLNAEDTQHMRDCLQALGVNIQEIDAPSPSPASSSAPLDNWDLKIQGQGAQLGRPDQIKSPLDAPLYVGTAGTVARFLTAALCSTGARVALDGSPRMRERPMDTLIEALRSIGAKIECSQGPNALPFELSPAPFEEGQGALRGGRIEMQRPASSQFISALVFAGIYAQKPLDIILREGTPARPYVDMTLRAVESFGGIAKWLGPDHLQVQPRPLQPTSYCIEPDASAASYFLALAAIYGGKIRIPGLGSQSLQGDTHFHRVLAAMGAQSEQNENSTTVYSSGKLRGCELDLSDMPDMTLTAAVAALFADSPTTIHGVEILRHHESDRLAAASAELQKLGALVEERQDGLKITPPGCAPNPQTEIRRGVAIETYLDHRMAMAFAMVGEVEILDPACTHKTYPGYFRQLQKLGMVAETA